MDEIRMYILINSSVKMTKGKCIAQAGHGISEVTAYMVKYIPHEWEIYYLSDHTKITLKCPLDLLKVIYNKYNDKNKDIWCINVIDAGRTQVEPGTMTAVIFKPLQKKDIPNELLELKLY